MEKTGEDTLGKQDNNCRNVEKSAGETGAWVSYGKKEKELDRPYLRGEGLLREGSTPTGRPRLGMLDGLMEGEI